MSRTVGGRGTLVQGRPKGIPAPLSENPAPFPKEAFAKTQLPSTSVGHTWGRPSAVILGCRGFRVGDVKAGLTAPSSAGPAAASVLRPPAVPPHFRGTGLT